MRFRKNLEQILVITTTALFAVVAVCLVAFVKPRMPEGIALDTAGQPYVGNPLAPIEIVIFLDPKCPMCRRFHHEVLPGLLEDYRDTNFARFTFMTLTFLHGGRPAGHALLEAHRQNPDLYYPMLEQVYAHQGPEEEDWATPEKMVALAQEVPGLETEEVELAIQASRHAGRLEANLQVALVAMNGDVMTPVVYIDGRRCPSLSKEVIEDMTERTLDYHGVY